MAVKVIGIEELEQALLDRASAHKGIEKIINNNGRELNKRMQKASPYLTGATRRSIDLVIKDNGLTAVVAPHTDYSPYLEFGTRFMEARPFVKPSWEKQKELFIQDIKELVK